MATIGMFLGIGIVTLGLAMYFKRPLMWIVGVIPWALMAVNGNRLSLETWDTYYFAWWIAVAMAIVCILMALQTRSLDIEETEIEPKPDDSDNYTAESEEYGEKQRKISKATARRSSSRNRK